MSVLLICVSSALGLHSGVPCHSASNHSMILPWLLLMLEVCLYSVLAPALGLHSGVPCHLVSTHSVPLRWFLML
jgi:hypothetical protein